MEFMRGLFMTLAKRWRGLLTSHISDIFSKVPGAQASTAFYIWKGVGPRT